MKYIWMDLLGFCVSKITNCIPASNEMFLVQLHETVWSGVKYHMADVSLLFTMYLDLYPDWISDCVGAAGSTPVTVGSHKEVCSTLLISIQTIRKQKSASCTPEC